MIEKEVTVSEIEEVIERLEHHLEVYNECKYQYENASKQKERDRAFKFMITHANFMRREFEKPKILEIIEGNITVPYTFENFARYADVDVSSYLVKLKKELEKRIKEEKKKEEKKE